MDDREALRAAARVFADAVRKQARLAGTDETADAVNIDASALDHVDVNAGHPGGRYGWVPIQAWMFETGAKHPLFGNDRHWYAQPERPFLERAAEEAIDDAMNAYADVEIPQLLDEYLPE